jgi:hypothetical protein
VEIQGACYSAPTRHKRELMLETLVILQGMKEDPPPGAKCKDKFLVQSMDITPDMVNTSFGAMVCMAYFCRFSRCNNSRSGVKQRLIPRHTKYTLNE